MKYWEIIADRLHAAGWSYGMVEHLTKHRLLFCVDAHRDGKRFVVKADDLLTTFLSLEGDAIAPKGPERGTRRARTSPRSCARYRNKGEIHGDNILCTALSYSNLLKIALYNFSRTR